MTRLVILLLASLLVMECGPVLAAPVCRSKIDIKNYIRKGGLLTHANKEPTYEFPPNFFCDRLGCFGDIDFSFLIDETGRVSNVSIMKNTWKIDPDYHASIVMPHIVKMRYAPPRLGDKPVCVLGKLHYVLGNAGK
jgi:hypothetical protein